MTITTGGIPHTKKPMLLLAILLTGCAAGPAASVGPSTKWVDPEGRFSIELPAPPTAKVKQEITGVGTVNFKVWAMDLFPYSVRVTAFAYPTAVPLDIPGELAHASGKSIARMNGSVENVVPITVDGVPGIEATFTVTEGGETARGVQRMFISKTPVRYHVFCLVPTDADFTPCQKMVQSMRPIGPEVPH